MMKKLTLVVVAALVAFTALTRPAVAGDDLAALREEVAALKEQIRILQEQMKGLLPVGGIPVLPPAAVAPPQPSPSAAPAPPGPTRSQNLLNPAISAVFQAVGNTSLRRADPGNGFDLSEAEVALQSAVDPFVRMELFLAFPADESPEVEEGIVSTIALPGPLALKGGRFKSAFGKWNRLHNHAFFTVDRPAALTNLLGEESLTNDGLSLGILIPNPWDAYIEMTTEVGTPREGPSLNSAERSLAYLGRLNGVFDTSANAALEIGFSAARGRTGPSDQLLSALSDPNLIAPPMPGEHLESALDGVDVTWKWKPRERNVYRSFLWQTEWLRSRREIESLQPVSGLARDSVITQGGYSYIEGQFTKRWRAGARLDYSGLPGVSHATERGAALVARCVLSDFQEIRFQAGFLRRNDAAAALFNGDEEETRILIQWIPVIGAHGAHAW